MMLAAVVAFTLASQTFSDGGTLPSSAEFNGYGCTGQNVQPELHWSDAPARTVSFAITMHDPDAKAPGGWWHWVVFDISGGVKSFGPMMQSSMTSQSFVYGTTSFGTRGYGGPCPPPGAPHHYVFTIYAIDRKLGADGSTTGPQLLKLIEGHVLGQATLTGLFGR
jgi:Raf kinase inhibitor-like YbhB/YbcL family protein